MNIHKFFFVPMTKHFTKMCFCCQILPLIFTHSIGMRDLEKKYVYSKF